MDLALSMFGLQEMAELMTTVIVTVMQLACGQSPSIVQQTTVRQLDTMSHVQALLRLHLVMERVDIRMREWYVK